MAKEERMSGRVEDKLKTQLNKALAEKKTEVTISCEELESLFNHIKWQGSVMRAAESAGEVIKLKQEISRLTAIFAGIIDVWNKHAKLTPETEALFQYIRPYINYLVDKVPMEKVTNACLVKAADDEPIFVLRAHDFTAPAAVRFWALNAKGHGLNGTKYDDALQVAAKMEEWPDRKMPD